MQLADRRNNSCKRARNRQHTTKAGETPRLTYGDRETAPRRAKWLREPCGWVERMHRHAQRWKRDGNGCKRNGNRQNASNKRENVKLT